MIKNRSDGVAVDANGDLLRSELNTNGFVLDDYGADGPYAGHVFTVPASGAWKLYTDSDTPGLEFVAGGLSYLTDYAYYTYLMFKPSGSGSQWVPLRIMSWDWGGKADGAVVRWTASLTYHHSSPTSSVWDQEPTWSNYLTNIGDVRRPRSVRGPL
jgi:hypothetical protein